MVEPERLDDGADLLVGVEDCFAVRVVAGHSGGELAPVLHVEQHPRHQPGDAVDVPRDRCQRGHNGSRGVVNSRHAALVVQFAHELENTSGEGPARIVDGPGILGNNAHGFL